jgi:hypothetical protein
VCVTAGNTEDNGSLPNLVFEQAGDNLRKAPLVLQDHLTDGPEAGLIGEGQELAMVKGAQARHIEQFNEGLLAFLAS